MRNSILAVFIVYVHVLNSGCHSKAKLADLPKVELHLHLDCSLSYEVVQKIDSTITRDEYEENFIAPEKCNDLADYISRAVRGFQLMQTREQLRLVTLDLFRQLKADHVVYAELRFAPLQHTLKGLTALEVVQTVNDAVTEGIAATGVDAGIILCTLRHYTEAQSMTTAKLVKWFRGTHVVGFDIAADEGGFPINNHISAFHYANENRLPCTAHAGEAKGAASVWETIRNFHPSRIGHGVRSTEDPALLKYLKEHDIHLEVCPTSNVQTNVYNRMKDHMVDSLYRTGVSIGINTDTRTISNTTLTKEYGILQDVFKWKNADLLRCNLAAIDHAFTTEVNKARLKKLIVEAYQ